jgi:hypothetical protein
MDRAIGDEDRVGVDGDLWIGACEVGRELPVRGGSTAFEQPGRGEHERAGAHGRGTAASPRHVGDGRDEL